MAESVNGGSGNQPPKEMSMEIRLLLAFILMGVVMFVTPYLFKTTPPPAQPKQTAAAPAAPSQSNQPNAPAAAAKEQPAEATPAETSALGPATTKPTQQEVLPVLVLATNKYRVVFSNQGANVRSWQLKGYKGNDDKPLELTNTAVSTDYPFSLYFPSQQPTSKVNWTYYQQQVDADGLGVSFDFSDGHTVVHKQFRFEKASYLVQVSSSVTVDGKPITNLIEWRGGFGDLTVPSPASTQSTLYFNVPDNKLVELHASAAKNGPATASGNFSFAGVADSFFAAVFLPQGSNLQMQEVTFSDTVRTVLSEKPVALSGVAVSDGDDNRFQLFVGPKDVDLLKKVNPKLEQVVDFGWFSFLAKPLFLIVNWMNDSFIHNFGWAIVLVTVVINMIMFPLKLSNMKSMRKMQALKPQIDEINKKYRDIGMRSPKKAEQNQEVMDLYKKYGVNPMGGCVPMLLQVPFFFAFYKVVRVSVEMRGASWLWVPDLSQAEPWPIKVLPIVMIASQFFMQKMTPQPNQDPNQAKMMMMMPLIFGVMFYNFPSGLVLYYLTSNLVNMGQQWFFNHTEAAVEAARSVEPPKKKTGRK